MSQVDFGNGLIIRDTNDSGVPQTAANSGIVDGRISTGISASDLDAVNQPDDGGATQKYVDSIVDGSGGSGDKGSGKGSSCPLEKLVGFDICQWILDLLAKIKAWFLSLLPDKKTAAIVALAALLLIIVLVKVVQ